MLTPISVIERIERINGGRMELWLSLRDIARRIIEAHGLHPLSTDAIATFTRPMTQEAVEMPTAEALTPAAAPTMKVMSRELLTQVIDPDTRGGMKIAHIHLDGKIFVLDGKTYRDFSQQIINNVQERISAAGSISFNQMLDVTEAAIGL